MRGKLHINLKKHNLALSSLFAVIFLAVLPTRLTAGGKVETVDGTTLITVVVPTLPNPTDTSVHNRAETAIVRQFEKDFPEIFRRKYLAKYQSDPAKYGKFDWEKIAVRLLPFSGLEVEGVESDLMAIAGGNPPDVLYVNFRRSDNYISNGFLYPLDKPEDGYFNSMGPEEISERIHPKIWPVIKRKGPNKEEHVWAIPTGGFLGRVLAYRKDLFDEAGIPYPTAEWTWDDMLEAAKKLTDPARGRVGLLMSELAGWEITTFLWSAGGEVMTYDEKNDQWQCTFGSPQGAEALDFYVRLTMEPWQTKEGQQVRGYALTDTKFGRAKWDRGQAGMLFSYVDARFFSDINPEVTGLAPVPKGPSGLRASELNSYMLGLFSQIKSPVVRDAAWEYISYLGSEAAARVRTKLLVEGGLGRFVNPRDLERFGYPEVARLAPKGWAEVFEITVSNGRPEPYGKNSNLAYRMLERPVNEAVQLALSNALPKDRTQRLQLLEDILRKAETSANALMIGKVSPEERNKRNSVAFVFLIGVVATFIFVFTRVFKTFSSGKPGITGRTPYTRRRMLTLLLLLPALLSILVWKYYPLLAGSVMGFQDYRLLGESNWVGLKHFGDMLWDDQWWQAIWNSLRFSFLALVFGFLPPMFLAILLQEVPHGKITYRLLFYLPAVLAGLVTLLLWKQFYDPSPKGALNALLAHVPAWLYLVVAGSVLLLSFALARRFWFHGQPVAGGVTLFVGFVFALSITSIAWTLLFPSGQNPAAWISRLSARLPEPIQWLRDPRYAMVACILPGIWAGMGPGCLIYLAALKGIPDDYYEAADIDGAHFLDKIIAIVLPTLRPLLVINFVGAFIGSWLSSSDIVLAMTAGQANTEVAPLSIFYKAFVFIEFGPATAMAWMLGFLLIGFTVYQLRMLARVEFRTTGEK